MGWQICPGLKDSNALRSERFLINEQRCGLSFARISGFNNPHRYGDFYFCLAELTSPSILAKISA